MSGRWALWAAGIVVGCASSASADGFRRAQYAKKPDAWFRNAEGVAAIENVLSHQSASGSWPKNVDTAAKRYAGNSKDLQGTFDNGATCGEARLLARAYKVASQPRCRNAVLKAIDHVLQAQYPTG